MYLRLPLSLVIDNARRLVLRHRVRSIKVSLGARRSAKSEKGEAVGRCAPTQTEPQKAKETAASRLHCHWSPRREAYPLSCARARQLPPTPAGGSAA